MFEHFLDASLLLLRVLNVLSFIHNYRSKVSETPDKWACIPENFWELFCWIYPPNWFFFQVIYHFVIKKCSENI